MTTYASHPGLLKANVMHVMGSYPLPAAAFAVAILGGLVVGMLTYNFYAWLVFGGAVFWCIYYASNIRPWFRDGDLCPAAVVCESPLLIAALANMATGNGWYPALKVVRAPARRFTAETRKVGRPIAAIARYSGTLALPTWVDFKPIPVQCATSEEFEIGRLLGEISPEMWAQLQAAIRLVPKPINKPGYQVLWATKGVLGMKGNDLVLPEDTNYV